ncbi:winged helix-turn-helix transcriptional regulator [Chitinophaga silvisoli]|uniref:Transcriptional regulator n=1 Tax=Chitinophaga silvisoli TaxID=2291814 RepID=A0A3E1NUC9_9BACT|nr:helix-turn-helix domain-containing protein [Chitinophaga silvisoli]RFM31513.1 transcriptional regulator [Chitinophaga silvisoli]
MAKGYERKIPILDCGHEYIRQVLHGRWKIALLLRIANGINRPGELARSIPQATRRVLDVQLDELVRHRLVDKQVFSGKIQHVKYALSELGESIMPVIAVMGKWGDEHVEQLKEVLDSKRG